MYEITDSPMDVHHGVVFNEINTIINLLCRKEWEKWISNFIQGYWSPYTMACSDFAEVFEFEGQVIS